MTTITTLPDVTGWRRQDVRYVEKWFCGVDIGQSTDPTAISVLRYTLTPLNTWTPIERTRLRRQDRVERFDVLHLERVKLGMSYPAQAGYVGRLLQRPPLNDGCQLVIDDTGVGRAVGDIFVDAGLRPKRITITAGLEPSQHGANTYHVPKAVLISTLEAHMHSGELRIAPDATDSEALKDELKDFQRKVSAAGRTTWDARVGKHDDLILSVAIALWMASHGPTISREELVI
jgi:hypothetical protein